MLDRLKDGLSEEHTLFDPAVKAWVTAISYPPNRDPYVLLESLQNEKNVAVQTMVKYSTRLICKVRRPHNSMTRTYGTQIRNTEPMSSIIRFPYGESR